MRFFRLEWYWLVRGFPKMVLGIGFESLYLEQEMGISSFMEEARYHRAVEAELVRLLLRWIQ